jgi:hypothetical protein
MHAQPALVRLFALLVVLALPIFAWAAGEEDSGRVGIVNKVKNQAQVVSASGATTAIIGTPVHMWDDSAPAPTRGCKSFSANRAHPRRVGKCGDRPLRLRSPIKASARPSCRRPRAPSVSLPGGSRSSATGRSRSPRPSPISGSAAPSSGADRSMPNMGSHCLQPGGTRDLVRAGTAHRRPLPARSAGAGQGLEH